MLVFKGVRAQLSCQKPIESRNTWPVISGFGKVLRRISSGGFFFRSTDYQDQTLTLNAFKFERSRERQTIPIHAGPSPTRVVLAIFSATTGSRDILGKRRIAEKLIAAGIFLGSRLSWLYLIASFINSYCIIVSMALRPKYLRRLPKTSMETDSGKNGERLMILETPPPPQRVSGEFTS